MLSYSEANQKVHDMISDLGFPLFMGEVKAQPQVKTLRKKVSAYYKTLGKENRLDVLHAFNAKNKAELLNRAVAELLERGENG